MPAVSRDGTGRARGAPGPSPAGGVPGGRRRFGGREAPRGRRPRAGGAAGRPAAGRAGRGISNRRRLLDLLPEAGGPPAARGPARRVHRLPLPPGRPGQPLRLRLPVLPAAAGHFRGHHGVRRAGSRRPGRRRKGRVLGTGEAFRRRAAGRCAAGAKRAGPRAAAGRPGRAGGRDHRGLQGRGRRARARRLRAARRLPDGGAVLPAARPAPLPARDAAARRRLPGSVLPAAGLHPLRAARLHPVGLLPGRAGAAAPGGPPDQPVRRLPGHPAAAPPGPVQPRVPAVLPRGRRHLHPGRPAEAPDGKAVRVPPAAPAGPPDGGGLRRDLFSRRDDAGASGQRLPPLLAGGAAHRAAGLPGDRLADGGLPAGPGPELRQPAACYLGRPAGPVDDGSLRGRRVPGGFPAAGDRPPPRLRPAAGRHGARAARPAVPVRADEKDPAPGPAAPRAGAGAAARARPGRGALAIRAAVRRQRRQRGHPGQWRNLGRRRGRARRRPGQPGVERGAGHRPAVHHPPTPGPRGRAAAAAGRTGAHR